MMNRRTHFAALVLLAFVLPPHALPQEAAMFARLQSVEQAQSLDDPELKPWHLKMAVRLFDAKGKPTETGTIEEWWAGPDKFRLVFSLPSYSATQVKNPDGFFRSTGSGRTPYVLARLLRNVVHPVQLLHDYSPELRKQKVNNTELDCIVLRPRIKGSSDIPPSMLTTYCMGRDDNTLLMSNDVAQVAVLGAVGKFQERHVAVDLSLFIGEVKFASEHFESLDIVPEAAGDFDKTDGLVADKNDPALIGAGTSRGRLLKSVQPVYPPMAKANRIAGMVVLHAIIGSDGHVRDLDLLSSPDDSLADSAKVAVRLWTYQPFTINGSPVDVETTIIVNFQMR